MISFVIEKKDKRNIENTSFILIGNHSLTIQISDE